MSVSRPILKRQLKFTLYENAKSIGAYSTFHPVGLRVESAIALRVSNLFGVECTVHGLAHSGATRHAVKFFDPSTDTFRELEAEIES